MIVKNKPMTQTEIQFFWPLTEQIPLDLNYEECVKPNVTVPITGGGILYNTSILQGTIKSSLNIYIDEYPIVIRSKKKPNIFARCLYKTLGIKWVE